MGRDVVGKALFGLMFRMTKTKLAKGIQPQAEELARKANIMLHAKRGLKRYDLKRSGRTAPRATGLATSASVEKVVPRPRSAFQEDMKTLRKRALSEARRDAREARITKFKELAAENPNLLNMGLEEKQILVLGELQGQFLGKPIPLIVLSNINPKRAEVLKEAVKAADELRVGFLKKWNNALPPRKSDLDAALKDVFSRLQQALKTEPNLNAGRFVREKLFNPWRERFMDNLFKDKEFIDKLFKETGVQIVKGASPGAQPRFLLKLKMGEHPIERGLDVDHAEERLTDAVKAALETKNPQRLLPVVRGEGLQLLMPLENRIAVEVLRRRLRIEDMLKLESAQRLTKADQNNIDAYYDAALDAFDTLLPGVDYF